VKTGENGHFEYLGLMEGTYYLECKAGGYAQLKSEKLDYTPGEYKVDFALVEQRRVNLTVVDLKGNPVAGVEVEADNAQGNQIMISTSPRSASSRVNADENGKLTMFGMPAEWVAIRLSKDWGHDLMESKHDLSAKGAHPIEIRLLVAVPEETQRIMIRFTDEMGASMNDISTDQDHALLVRAYDLEGYLVDSAQLWRAGEEWKQLRFAEATDAKAGAVMLYVPSTGGRIEIDADGFESRSRMISAADGENPRQRLSLELVPN